MPFLRKWRSIWLIHAGILLTFALVPVWYRLPQSPLFARLYVTRFLIFLPIIWSVVWWVVLGVPGLRDLARSRWRSLWALALLLLALWGFASQVWAFQRVDYPEVGATAALQFGVSALFAVVVACAAPKPSAIVTVLILSLIGNAAITILQAQNQASLGLIGLGEFPFNPTQPGVSILQSGALRWVRPYGLQAHPNLLAGALLVGVLATGGWIIARRGWLRAAGVLIFGFGFWALLLTFSRAAWGGLVVGGLSVVPFLRLYLRRLDTRISLAAAAAAALVVGLAFVLGYQPLLAARAGEGQESVELRSVSDRLVFMDFAFRSIRERPILGVGIGNFPWRTSYYLVETDFDLRGDNVHNVLLSVTAELGVVGLTLALAAIGCGAVTVVAGLRASVWQSQTVRGDAHPARLALFAVFAALLAVGFLDHYPWTQIHFQAAWWGCLAAAFPRELSTA
ncbi:MAG: O-antigen ligase family protein [Anaerolineae bacterium]|nr:O-antigen ligase family protein [Anaerolineae bacterium]